NIEKLLYWIFNRGPLRGWGTIVGTWNTFDVSGLVGEANDGGNDYAFQLNGVQQAGALVPLVRYDKRFARAIGKWMLNVSNATRLMYPGFLPSHLQDADAWSDVNDPKGVMGYEALREQWQGSSPFSTGDALKGGWAATNLSLYSTSSIGYMGSLIETTNEEMILKLDLLKTDFFNDTAYPSYLFFNPYLSQKSVLVNVGQEPKDIYDAISETFLVQNATGEITIAIPADEAVSIVIAPAGGTISYVKNKMLINDIVVDFMQTSVPYNGTPRIQAFATQSYTVEKNSTVTLYGKGIDQETKDLTYTFIWPGGNVSGLEKTAEWTAPDQEGSFEMKLIIEDEDQQTDTAVILIEVVSEINIAPEIHNLTASTKYTSPGGTISLHADVTDLNNDVITYTWSATQGDIIGSDDLVDWLAPQEEGISTITLMVSDGRGGTATANIRLIVLDPDLFVDGNVIAWYPFEGNAQDISGNMLHGQVLGAKLNQDSLGNPSAAYFFDGINDHIKVTNSSILNFDEGITLTCFAKPGIIGDKERFIVSHGSWQNRWKISITPDRKVRWTLKTANGQVRDLDSETILEPNAKTYHIGTSYDGRYMMMYINGRLESFIPFTGNINTSPLDLEIGQILPDDQMYNYSGILDEIKIFDYALRPDSVASESGMIMTGIFNPSSQAGMELSIHPNPADDYIILNPYDVTGIDDYTVSISDAMGQTVRKEILKEINQKIDISTLSSGYYVVKLQQNNTVWTKAFVIEKLD
ncbi:MAG TPA: LamG-like jellyroll fold domain-containing protein, partial [Saprospiraceae bacterium]